MGSLSKRSPRRWSFEGLIPVCLSVARRAYVSAPNAKQSTGRRPFLGLVLATHGDVQCNMLAERGASKSDGWGSGSSAAEWYILPAVGELVGPKAEARSVLRRAMSSARTRKLSSVWCVAGDQQEGPIAETKKVLGRAVSSARSWKCRLCGRCPATNRRGPCHLTAVVVAVVGGRALPSLRSHPRRNRDCGLDEKQKQNRYEKQIGEIGGTLPQ